MLNVMLVINPFAGRGISKPAVGTIVSQLCGGGFIVTVFFAGEFTPEELTYEHAKNYDMVVCVGGDGTLSSVFSGLVRSGLSIPVGYVPAGTANDVANTLALPRYHSAAVKTIMNGEPRPLDIGRFADRYFSYIAAFGAFTGVSYLTPQNAKRALGHFAYVLNGLADMSTIRPIHTVVEYDEGLIEGDFLFGSVTNSTSVAGLVKLDPKRVDLADGLFEIILVRQPVNPTDLLDIFAGLAMQTYDGDNLHLIHSSNVKFTFDEDVAWTIDGEDGGPHKEVSISNCNKAVSIIVKKPTGDQQGEETIREQQGEETTGQQQGEETTGEQQGEQQGEKPAGEQQGVATTGQQQGEETTGEQQGDIQVEVQETE